MQQYAVNQRYKQDIPSHRRIAEGECEHAVSMHQLACSLRNQMHADGLWLIGFTGEMPETIAESILHSSISVCWNVGLSDAKQAFFMGEAKEFFTTEELSRRGLEIGGIEIVQVLPVFYQKREPFGLVVAGFSHSASTRDGFPRLKDLDSQLQCEWKAWHLDAVVTGLKYDRKRAVDELHEMTGIMDQLAQDLRLANLRAEESSRLKQAFLANLSHEIRTPMNVILGFGELLKDAALNQEERKEFLDIMHQNGLQLLRIMDNLIDLSRIETDLSLSTDRRVDLFEWIQSFLKNYWLKQVGETSSVSLRLIIPPDLRRKPISVYEKVLSKVLTHLLDNAFKFTSVGSVTVDLGVMDAQLVLKIIDTGSGIAEGEEEVIFEAFRQSDLNYTRKYGGVGIGLSLVRKYISIVSGKVSAANNVSGPGATFTVVVPLLPN